jgi:hypothetical protein
MFHVLPLLKAWEWNVRWYNFAPTKELETSFVNRGVGWLMEIDLAMDDCFAEVEFNFKGSSKSGLVTRNSVYPQYLFCGSTFQSGEMNSLTRYSRPSKTSSAGIYIIRMFTGISSGSTLPLLDKSLIKTRLLSGSTQSKCSITVGVITIDITDVEAFIKSIREVQGTRNLHIDKALLAE